MSLKKKLLFIISIVAIISSIVSLFAISQLSLTEMKKDALTKAQFDLTAKRTLITSELANYLETIEKQAVVMASGVSIKEATQEFVQAFFKYDESNYNLASLDAYYTGQFKPTYDQQNSTPINTSNLYRSLPSISKAMQSQFISLNPNPLGEKDNLNSINDNSEYDLTHKRYHSSVRTFLKEFGYYDVFIVEPTQGYIVYSVFKELDFATSLKFGPYKNTGIAEAFNEGLNLNKGETYLTDFEAYLPSYNNAASFISTPIYEGNKLLGVLIFQMPIDRLNNLMTQKEKWAESGFGESGEIYLVGQDKTLRNESRFFVEDKEGYLSLIKRVGMTQTDQITNKDTTIAIQPVETEGVRDALSGSVGFAIFNDYREVPVLSSYGPIEFGNNRWAIMSEIDEEEAFKAVNTLSNYIWGTALTIITVIAIVAAFIALQLSNSLVKPLTILASRFESLSQGEADLTVRLDKSNTPEINKIVLGFNAFIGQISEAFSSVQEAVSRIASSGTELGVTTEQTNVTLNEQENSIKQVHESIEQFSVSVSEINNQTQTALTDANEAKDKTEENAERATLAADNIKQLVTEVNKSSKTIKQLQDSVKGIGDVLGVINAIAEQTNLLALNAAIEAARAGEQGRGFAVVADEVRSLASRTQESTVTIQTQITQLTDITQQSFESMERASISAEGGIHLVDDVNETLHELKETIVKLSSMSSEISSAAQMQGYSIENITESMTELNNRAKEITEASANITGVASELSSVAEELKEETKRYKV